MSEEKVDAWMPLWIGAYLADTMHLTRDLHGGYLLLLFAYWRNRGPIEDDDEDLAAITRATPAEWKKLRPKLAKFFTIADGAWLHTRADKELTTAGLRKAAASAKARAAAEKRWGKSRGMLEATSEECSNKCQWECLEHATSIGQAVPEQCPTPTPKRKEISKAPPSHPAAVASGRFDAFWQAYPRKVGKDAARKAFEKRRPSADLVDAMLEAIAAQRRTEQWQRDGGQYVPHPSTWLNEGRWQDETPVEGQGAGEAWHESRAGTEAMGEKLGIGRWDQDAFDHGRGPAWPAYRGRVLRAAGVELEAA